MCVCTYCNLLFCRFSNDYIDRSKIDVGSLCNIERENVAAEDDARFSVYLTVSSK